MMNIVSGSRELNRQEFEELVLRVVSGLNALGVEQGDSVALLLVNEIEFLLCSQALAYLGAYAVPINWRSTASEAGYICRDANVKGLVAHSHLMDVANAAAPDGGFLIEVPLPAETADALRVDRASARTESAIDWDQWLASLAPHEGPRRLAPPAIIYTSGTTGKPKGVVRQSHVDQDQQSALNNTLSQVFGTRDGMRTVICAPLYHAGPAAYMRSVLTAIKTGGAVVLMPKFDPEELLRIIERHRISHIWMVPTMFVRLLQLSDEVKSRYDLSSLRHVVHSAAPCPADVKLKMIEWWGPVVMEFYGTTETGPLTFTTAEEYLEHPGTVGRLLDGCELKVSSGGEILTEPGQIGEFVGLNTAYARFTYRNRNEDRSAIDVGGLIATGDIGYVDEDGFYYVCDRKKDMVISGGVNIYPAEIEAVMFTIPEIADCAVIGVPDSVFGESLLAVVKKRPEASLHEDKIRDVLLQSLSSVKVPRGFVFVNEMPRDESGKIFKHKLREEYGELSKVAEN